MFDDLMVFEEILEDIMNKVCICLWWISSPWFTRFLECLSPC